MTAVAIQRNTEQARSHEHNQTPSSEPPSRRQNLSNSQITSGLSQQHRSTAAPPNAARTQNTPVARAPPFRAPAKESRDNSSANGVSATTTPDIMPAQHADVAAGRTANGASQRRIDTIIGGNIHAGRRNQSSATLTDGNKANGETTTSRRPAQLQRSKSDYGPRVEEAEPQHEEEAGHDWGARHGFDGHYASDDFVIQLANVSSSFCLFSFLVALVWALHPFTMYFCYKVSILSEL